MLIAPCSYMLGIYASVYTLFCNAPRPHTENNANVGNLLVHARALLLRPLAGVVRVRVRPRGCPFALLHSVAAPLVCCVCVYVRGAPHRLMVNYVNVTVIWNTSVVGRSVGVCVCACTLVRTPYNERGGHAEE